VTRVAKLSVAALLLLGVIVAGCGGGGDSSSTSSTAESTESESGSAAFAPLPDSPEGVHAGFRPDSKEAKIGEEVGAEAGKPVSMPKKKVGLLLITGAVESAQIAASELENAVAALGWETITCDGQGDPTKMTNCMSTLLNQHVEAVFNLAVEPTLIRTQLAEAKTKGIPVFQYASITADDSAFTGSYDTLEAEGAEVLDDYLLPQLQEQPDRSTIALQLYAAGFAETRAAQLEEDLKSYPKVSIVATGNIDGVDPEGSTQANVSAQLIQYPDLGAIYSTFDSPTVSAARVVQTKYAGKKFPDRPLVVGFNVLPASLKGLREGAIDAIVNVPNTPQAWIAADQAAGFFAREKTPAKTNPEYPIEMIEPKLITEDNVPASGGSFPPESDYSSFFIGKWKTEYSNLGG